MSKSTKSAAVKTTATKTSARAKKLELSPAQKAWLTRRANGETNEAALAAWETRRANEAAAAKEAAKGARAKKRAASK